MKLIMNDRGIRAGEWESAIVHYRFFLANNYPRDTVNLMQSVKAAVDGATYSPPPRCPSARLLTGDSWQQLALGNVHVEIDRDNPRVELVFVRTYPE